MSHLFMHERMTAHIDMRGGNKSAIPPPVPVMYCYSLKEL